LNLFIFRLEEFTIIKLNIGFRHESPELVNYIFYFYNWLQDQ